LVRSACARIPIERSSLTADGFADNPRLAEVLRNFVHGLAGHQPA
jgi:hypothetical protein